MRRTIESFRRDTARRLRANATNAEELLDPPPAGEGEGQADA
jgi:hypothetical protein